MTQKENRSYKEEFATFFETPDHVNLRDLLKNNSGEFRYLDYKESWPSYPKVARLLLGLGNSEGGCVIVGAAEKGDGTLDPKGIDKLEDKAVIIDGIKKYIPPQIVDKVVILDFSYDETEYAKIKGKKFQVVLINIEPKDLPLIARSEYPGEIRNNAIYIRRGTSTEEANYEELQEIVNRRLNTEYSSQRENDLRVHLEQLKILLDERDRAHFAARFLFASSVLGGTSVNDFKDLMDKMVEKKIRRIDIALDT